MDESDDFCPTRPKRAKLIHAACVTVLRVDQVASMVHLIPSGALTFVDPRRGDQFRVAVGGESDHLLRLVDFVVMETAEEYPGVDVRLPQIPDEPIHVVNFAPIRRPVAAGPDAAPVAGLDRAAHPPRRRPSGASDIQDLTTPTRDDRTRLWASVGEITSTCRSSDAVQGHPRGVAIAWVSTSPARCTLTVCTVRDSVSSS